VVSNDSQRMRAMQERDPEYSWIEGRRNTRRHRYKYSLNSTDSSQIHCQFIFISGLIEGFFILHILCVACRIHTPAVTTDTKLAHELVVIPSADSLSKDSEADA
jgi:hypothetical protein